MRRVVHYVDSNELGGAERVLVQVVSGLDRRRWQPVVMHPPAPELAPMIEAVRDAGVELRGVPRVSDRNAALRLPSLVHNVRAARPDVFHAHLSWPLACKYGVLAAALTRATVVATVHLFVESLVNRSVRWQHRIVSRAVDRYVAVSAGVAARMHDAFGVSRRRIEIVHNGIDVTRFDVAGDAGLRARLCRGRRGPVVMTVARLGPQKAHHVLLEAAERIPGVVVVLVGDGPLRASLERETRRRRMQDRVVFTGHRDDVADLLACADVFVLPSLFEGHPLSILEAMAAGKPIVATRVAGTDETVVDGESGLLVPPGDAVALAEAIRTLLADPVRARGLAAAAHRRARERFSVETMVERLTALYDRVVAPRARRRAG